MDMRAPAGLDIAWLKQRVLTVGIPAVVLKDTGASQTL
jgi:hypothetical protein